MNLKKLLKYAAGISLIAGIGSGCGGAVGGGSGVAYLNFDDNDTFIKLIETEFEKSAQSQGLNVKYYDAKGDINLQVDQMNEALASGVKSIVLIAADGNLIVPSVEHANAQGVTVITLNRDINGGEKVKVASDDYEAGKLQGDYLSKTLPKNSNVVYLEGTSTQSGAVKRWEGFKASCLDKRGDIELLDMQDGNYSKTEAMKIMALWMELFPKIDAVVCGNDQMALGAVAALKKSGRLAGCQVSGVDAVDDALKAVASGEMVQTIKQDAVKQAQGAAELAATVEKGGKPADVNVPFLSITKENVSQFLK